MKVEYFISGKAVAQGRPKACKIGDRIRLYDPSTSREWKEAIRWQVNAAGARYLEGALEMQLTFTMARPKSHYGAKGLKPAAPVFHTSKPDLDNLVKAVKDALEGLCYKNDSQICREIHCKMYGNDHGVLISIKEI